ncbi:MAG: glycosyltransferase family 2 protein [Bacteroidota bacterium]|nr:glycosyltransferase family 2 protein [Bacteroidota bacterium]
MPELSLIFGFRNREISRVENCIRSLEAQTFKNFEVIFVDYGSDTSVSVSLKLMLGKYKFVNYIFNDTQGRPWNRAHALNTGIRAASGEYVINLDIDLVFSPGYVRRFYDSRKKDKVILSNFYLLPERYDFVSGELPSGKFDLHTGATGIGIYPAGKLKEIGCYDEYYQFWGCEDRDLKLRLEKVNVTFETMNILEAPVYHQWHPQTGFQRDFLPSGWWEEMNLYLFANKNKVERNTNRWGYIFNREERISLNYLQKGTVQNEFNTDQHTNLVSLFESISDSFYSAGSGEVIKLVCPDTSKVSDIKQFLPKPFFYKVLNKSVYLINKDLRILDFYKTSDSIAELKAAKLFGIEKSTVRNMCWHFITKNKEQLRDFYFGEFEGNFCCIIVKN